MPQGKILEPEVVDEMLEMHSAGLTPAAIASELPMSLPSVYTILKEYGLKPNKKTVLRRLRYVRPNGDVIEGEKAVDLLLGMYYKNVPLRKIRKAFGLKDNNIIYQLLAKRGLPPRAGL